MRFRIIRLSEKRETIAEARGIRELSRLNKVYGDGRWRKLKGIALIRAVQRHDAKGRTPLV